MFLDPRHRGRAKLAGFWILALAFVGMNFQRHINLYPDFAALPVSHLKELGPDASDVEHAKQLRQKIATLQKLPSHLAATLLGHPEVRVKAVRGKTRTRTAQYGYVAEIALGVWKDGGRKTATTYGHTGEVSDRLAGIPRQPTLMSVCICLLLVSKHKPNHISKPSSKQMSNHTCTCACLYTHAQTHV